MDTSLLTGIFLSCIVMVRSGCGGGWIRYLDHCYLFQYTRSSFFNSEQRCHIHSAHLVSIHSHEENKFLLTEAQKLYITSPDSKSQMFWIGYHYSKTDAEYKWTDESIVDYDNWKWNKTTDVRDGRFHFAAICNSSLWCDVTDSRIFQYYICKKSSGLSLPGHCPDDSVVDPSTKHCYIPLKNKTTWRDAIRRCTSLVLPGARGHLLTINSLSEVYFLGAFPTAIINSLETWINCQDIDGDGQWADDHCDGQKLFLPSIWYNMAFPGGCGVVNIYTSLWYSTKCDVDKAVICEIEKDDDDTIPQQSLVCLEQTTHNPSDSITSVRKDSMFNITKTSQNPPVSVTPPSFLHRKNTSTSSYPPAENLPRKNNFSKISKSCRQGTQCDTQSESSNFDVTLDVLDKTQTTTERAYKKKKIQTAPPSAKPAHVAVGALGILLFVILIGAVFISDVRMLFIHITRGVDVSGGKTTKSRMKKASSSTSVSIDLQEHNGLAANSKYLTTSAALRNMGLL